MKPRHPQRQHYRADGSSKACYTKAQAKQWARRARKKYGHTVKAYECPYCASWHIGSQPDRRDQP